MYELLLRSDIRFKFSNFAVMIIKLIKFVIQLDAKFYKGLCKCIETPER